MKYSDVNKPLQCFMTQSSCYRGTYIFKPKGVLWHCTGANNPNLWRYVQPSDNDPNREGLLAKIGRNVYGSDWNHQPVSAGVNAWIGKAANGEVMAVQALPWEYAPWGCGGAANGTHIQFEMCEDALTDSVYFKKCYNEGVELTAYLCKKYGIDPRGTIWLNGKKVPTILCHYDAYNLGVGTGHYDVYNWFNKFGKTMEDVRDDVAALLGGGLIKYKPHVQTFGWMDWAEDAEVAGTTGKSKRLEALMIDPPAGVELDVDVHLQGTGWKTYKGIVHGNSTILGTVGESRRMEAIRIRCVKNNTGKKLKYQVHVQTYGWQLPCSEGETAGTTGVSKRMEAIKIWFD